MLIDSVVCWRWRPKPGYRSTYPPEAVNTLRSMVARHYPHPHRFICVTDDTDGLDRRVEVVPPWNDFEGLDSPHGRKAPSCYRRLRMFHPDIGQTFGQRFVSLDLDVVVTDALGPLWNVDDDIKLWGKTSPRTWFNGSMVLLKAGSRPHVWEQFARDPQLAIGHASRYYGSDQAWLSHALSHTEAMWTKADGVYSFRNDIKPIEGRPLPQDARLVVFHGQVDPWGDTRKYMSWVHRHYR